MRAPAARKAQGQAPDAQHARENPAVRRAAQLLGIGAVGASAAVATVRDFAQFRCGAQFGAWCGIMPRQHSRGGKTQLGRIMRRGDGYLRTLLIQGAKSAVLTAHKRSDPISRWAHALRHDPTGMWRRRRRATRTRASCGR